MKRAIFLAIMLMSLILGSSANLKVERIILKNGNQYEGYISSQYIGNEIMFHAIHTKVTITIKKDSVFTPLKKTEENLDQAWVLWANENNKFVTENGKKHLPLYRITEKGKKDLTVFITEESIEKNNKTITYESCDPVSVSIKYNDINLIETFERPANAVTGTTDVITLNNGTTLNGQIVCKKPGKQLSILLDNGTKKNIPFEDVKSTERIKLCESYSLIEQTDFIDVVVSKLDDSRTEGVIVENNGTQLVVETRNGMKKTYNIDIINRLERVENHERIKDIALSNISQGQIAINGTKVNPMNAMSLPFSIKNAQPVNIHLVDNQLCIDVNTDDNMGRLKLFRTVSDKNKIEYKEIVKNEIEPIRAISIGNIIRRYYSDVTTGSHGIYLPTSNKIVVFHVY